MAAQTLMLFLAQVPTTEILSLNLQIRVKICTIQPKHRDINAQLVEIRSPKLIIRFLAKMSQIGPILGRAIFWGTPCSRHWRAKCPIKNVSFCKRIRWEVKKWVLLPQKKSIFGQKSDFLAIFFLENWQFLRQFLPEPKNLQS